MAAPDIQIALLAQALNKGNLLESMHPKLISGPNPVIDVNKLQGHRYSLADAMDTSHLYVKPQNISDLFTYSTDTYSYIAFPGSNEAADFATALQTEDVPVSELGNVRVNAAMYKYLNTPDADGLSPMDRIYAYARSTGKPVMLTGHSLGGSLAHLAARLYDAKSTIDSSLPAAAGLYTFGEMRFAEDALTAKTDAVMGTGYFRIVKEGDAIAGFPPEQESGYKHGIIPHILKQNQAGLPLLELEGDGIVSAEIDRKGAEFWIKRLELLDQMTAETKNGKLGLRYTSEMVFLEKFIALIDELLEGGEAGEYALTEFFLELFGGGGDGIALAQVLETTSKAHNTYLSDLSMPNLSAQGVSLVSSDAAGIISHGSIDPELRSRGS